MKLKLLTTILALIAVPVVSFASNSAIEPFSKEAFETAQQENKTILLDFYASWCSTCRAQSPILESLAQEDEFSNLVMLRVDYDSADELKKEYSVAKQSTLILLKGDKELDRAMGLTNKEAIHSFLSQKESQG